MNRVVPLVLVLLLAGASGFGVYEYWNNQQRTQDNADLKQQLDTTAEQLREAEAENVALTEQLNQTQAEVTQLQTRVQELENKVKELEANITSLQHQLDEKRANLEMRTGAITVGLTFLWSPQVEGGFQLTTLQEMVDGVNKIFAPAKIYFFIYHAQSASFIPYPGSLCESLKAWTDRGNGLYPNVPDIPIAIMERSSSDRERKRAGCALIGAGGIAVGGDALFDGGRLLAHEIGHNLGIGEEGHVYSLPAVYFPMLQAAARRHQMPLPSESS